MSKKSIEPHIILTIDIYGYRNISFILKNVANEILLMDNILKIGSYYTIRQLIISKINELCNTYDIDMIIMEDNHLFIDKIDLHPDPLVLRDIRLGFGIQVSIDDAFHDKIKYIMQIPQRDWTKIILNPHSKYSIDLYKAHVLNNNYSEEQLKAIEDNNYYKALCLSESIWFDKLIDKKYQINKGD